MRKIKKINGYLVVKFNDRELREWDGTALGNYGVIDAELYTGSLDIDRGVMEYDGAETLDEAVELARGLESEEDIPEEEPSYTVVTETNDHFTEEEVFPQLLINGWETQLKTQVKSSHYKDVDTRTAAHELYGFKVALNRLGLLADDDTFVLPDTFGEAEPTITATITPHRQGDGGILTMPLRSNVPNPKSKDWELTTCPVCGVECWESQIAREAMAAEPNLRAACTACALQEGVQRKQKTLTHLDAPLIGFGVTREKVVLLGKLLEADCPENDCRLYLNVFHNAQEVDAALDKLDGYAAIILQKELRKLYNELRRMYRENHAVQKFKEGMQP